jgi:hypothetical protein
VKLEQLSPAGTHSFRFQLKLPANQIQIVSTELNVPLVAGRWVAPQGDGECFAWLNTDIAVWILKM